MKLNYKQTIYVGFAFFLICAFWQAYDTVIPLSLTNKFGLSQTASGGIMAIDNVLALFLLPLFGKLSDRCTSRYGRRTPYVVVGTLCAAVSFFALSFVDRMQLAHVERLSEGTALLEFGAQARAAHPATLVLFIVVLLITLLSMASFRSPAVALMPDVTIKPLRSKGNAVINLMGSAGGIVVLVLGMVFATGKEENAMMSYTLFFGTVALLMLGALALFLWKVREPRLVRRMEEDSARYGIQEDAQEEGNRKLQKEERRSLLFLLLSVALWYMAYNAVTSKYSVYASRVLDKDYNLTLILAQAAAIVSYLPVGMLASKIGRKKTILAGVLMLTGAFFVACFMHKDSPTWLMNCMFALAGIGWATINVNSFPMVVELCRGGQVGAYTGIYYTASMAAQTVTPLLSGQFMDRLGLRALFPYAVVFSALAFVTMLFVKHGDNRPTAKRGLEALDVED